MINNIKNKILKKKKGFSMLELIIIIVIVAIIAFLIVPSIIKYFQEGKQKYYEKLEQELVVMAKDYYTENSEKLPRGQLNKEGNPIYNTKITTNFLQESNYITNNVIDTEGKDCADSFIRVENINGKFVYYPCLICENYKTESLQCSFTEDNDNTNPSCEVELKTLDGELYSGDWTNKQVTAHIKAKDDNGIGMLLYNSVKIPVKENNNSNEYTGIYNFNNSTTNLNIYVYDKTGNRGECAISNYIKIDLDNPECTNIKSYEDGWQREKSIKVNATDKSSGVKNITITNLAVTKTIDNKNMTAIANNVTKEGKYDAVITDYAGNQSSCSITIDKIDRTKPVCTISALEAIEVGETRKVKLTCTDKESGVEKTKLSVNDFTKTNNNITISSVSEPIKVTNGYQYDITLKGSKTGNYQLKLSDNKISDIAGNKNDEVNSKVITINPKKAELTMTCDKTTVAPWETVTCDVKIPDVIMTCDGDVSIYTDENNKKTFTTTTKDTTKSCLPIEEGTLIIKALKDGEEIYKRIPVVSNSKPEGSGGGSNSGGSGGNGGSGSGGGTYKIKYCTLRYGFDNAYDYTNCYEKPGVTSCPVTYPTPQECFHIGNVGPGEPCAVSCTKE